MKTGRWPAILLGSWLFITASVPAQEPPGALPPSAPSALLPSEERQLREASEPPPARAENPGPGNGGGMGGPGGGGGFGFGGVGLVGGNVGPIAAQGIYMPRQNLQSQPYSVGVQSVGLRGGVPLWLGGGPILTLNLQQVGLDVEGDPRNGPLRLPRTGSIFPDSLTNINLGLIYRKTFANGWTGSIGANFGSASDRPFHSIRELNAGMNAMLIVPKERDAWIFSLFYSPTSQLWFPVPGVAYRWQPDEAWTVTLGIPFAIRYRPDDIWTFEMSYLPVTNVTARLSARVEDWATWHLSYLIRNESFFLADRVDYRDRFMIMDQRVVTGVTIPLVWKFAADLSAGYAFNRFFYEGQRSIGPASERLRIDPGLFVSAQLGIKF